MEKPRNIFAGFPWMQCPFFFHKKTLTKLDRLCVCPLWFLFCTALFFAYSRTRIFYRESPYGVQKDGHKILHPPHILLLRKQNVNQFHFESPLNETKSKPKAEIQKSTKKKKTKTPFPNLWPFFLAISLPFFFTGQNCCLRCPGFFKFPRNRTGSDGWDYGQCHCWLRGWWKKWRFPRNISESYLYKL